MILITSGIFQFQFKAVISFGEDIRIMTDVVIGSVPLVNHFRTPPYHAETTEYDGDPKCAQIASFIAPSVDWSLRKSQPIQNTL